MSERVSEWGSRSEKEDERKERKRRRRQAVETNLALLGGVGVVPLNAPDADSHRVKRMRQQHLQLYAAQLKHRSERLKERGGRFRDR